MASKNNASLYARAQKSSKICRTEEVGAAIIVNEGAARLNTGGEKEDAGPQKLGLYELVWRVAHDALSATYAAKREGIDGMLAVRVFNERVRSELQVRQIKKAADKARELTHPNALIVYETGVSDEGAPYVVSEWLEGESLAEVILAAKRLDIARFLNILLQIGDALCEAHSRQLIHANLSPSKIIFVSDDDGLDQVKVIDFGMPLDPVQNAFYVSPEQCLDKTQVNARADIYSLGCIMYECLVGSPPFVGHQKSHVALNYLHELAGQYSPRSPEHQALKLLDCIVVKCLQAKPSKRFGSMRELVDALKLVNDFIAGGSDRKLPPKAERLLLFRFLDLFDKKITAGLFIYFAVGLGMVKYVQEVQLQKHIDQAQTALLIGNLSQAQSNWQLAIKQAESANKPPSLQADLHFELGDIYRDERMGLNGSGVTAGADLLAEDAIGQYQLAFNYFKHGAHFRSIAIGLLQEMGTLRISMSEESKREADRESVHKLSRSLLASKKFIECADAGQTYLHNNDDRYMSELTATAYNEHACRLPAKKALRYFERAAYFANQSGKHASEKVNLAACINALGFEADSPDTDLALSLAALKEGDVEAASGAFFVSWGIPIGMDLNGQSNSSIYMATAQAVNGFLRLRSQAYQALPVKSASLTEGIKNWEQALVLEEDSLGKHNIELVPTLANVASCYLVAGRLQRAAEAYEKLFESTSFINTSFDGDALIYADLLKRMGRQAEAVAFLETRLRKQDGTFSIDSPLYVRLIKAYQDHHQSGEAADALLELTGGTPITPDRAVIFTMNVRDVQNINDTLAGKIQSKGAQPGKYTREEGLQDPFSR